jgi:hypothetical protein
MARFAAHFKLYGTAYITKPVSQLLYGKGAETFWDAMIKGKGDLMGLAQLTSYGMLLGFVSLQLKNIVFNRSLDNPFDLKTLIESFVAGGGAGIYNDLIFNNFNKFGNDPLVRAAGPDVATMNEYIKLISGTAAAAGARIVGKQKPTFPTNAIFHAIKNNIPFINGFQFKWLFDWLIWNHMQNTIDPSYFNRQLHRLNAEGKHYLIN